MPLKHHKKANDRFASLRLTEMHPVHFGDTLDKQKIRSDLNYIQNARETSHIIKEARKRVEILDKKAKGKELTRLPEKSTHLSYISLTSERAKSDFDLSLIGTDSSFIQRPVPSDPVPLLHIVSSKSLKSIFTRMESAEFGKTRQNSNLFKERHNSMNSVYSLTGNHMSKYSRHSLGQLLDDCDLFTKDHYRTRSAKLRASELKSLFYRTATKVKTCLSFVRILEIALSKPVEWGW